MQCRGVPTLRTLLLSVVLMPTFHSALLRRQHIQRSGSYPERMMHQDQPEEPHVSPLYCQLPPLPPQPLDCFDEQAEMQMRSPLWVCVRHLDSA